MKFVKSLPMSVIVVFGTYAFKANAYLHSYGSLHRNSHPPRSHNVDCDNGDIFQTLHHLLVIVATKNMKNVRTKHSVSFRMNMVIANKIVLTGN